MVSVPPAPDLLTVPDRLVTHGPVPIGTWLDLVPQSGSAPANPPGVPSGSLVSGVAGFREGGFVDSSFAMKKDVCARQISWALTLALKFFLVSVRSVVTTVADNGLGVVTAW